jgi:hypothetical protein
VNTEFGKIPELKLNRTDRKINMKGIFITYKFHILFNMLRHFSDDRRVGTILETRVMKLDKGGGDHAEGKRYSTIMQNDDHYLRICSYGDCVTRSSCLGNADFIQTGK